MPVRVYEPVDPAQFEHTARLAMPQAASGMAFAATAPSLHAITIDTVETSGGSNSGPEPLGLLLLALGSCTGMDVISILRKKRQVITSYIVNVYADQATEHPRVYTRIVVEHVVGGENVAPDAVARAIELSITRYCPVHAMLAKATSVEHVYRILDSASVSTEADRVNE